MLRLVFMVAAGAVVLTFVILAILDHLNITHIFMKGWPSGTIGNAMRVAQDAFEANARKAHEYVIEKHEEKDKSSDQTGSAE